MLAVRVAASGATEAAKAVTVLPWDKIIRVRNIYRETRLAIDKVKPCTGDGLVSLCRINLLGPPTGPIVQIFFRKTFISFQF